MKWRIWSVFFTVFFRLPIYESIAAIFWQYASYVYIAQIANLWQDRLFIDIKWVKTIGFLIALKRSL